LYDDAQPCKL